MGRFLALPQRNPRTSSQTRLLYQSSIPGQNICLLWDFFIESKFIQLKIFEISFAKVLLDRTLDLEMPG